ncbi:hypothetical protein DENSPDRAFT_754361, partial [Dentipellis sp. KUC8613]
PAWVTEAKEFLTSGPKCPEWARIMDNWLDIESLMRYPDGANWLNTSKRPPQVAAWGKRGRDYGWVPQLGTLSSFASAWRAWWRSLQPEWRRDLENEWPMSRNVPAEESWSTLKKGGKNGLVTVLIPIAWW